MNNIEVFVDRYNMLMGTVIAILSYVLGEHWFLFVAFLGLNVLDWLTGWMKSRMTGRENRSEEHTSELQSPR